MLLLRLRNEEAQIRKEMAACPSEVKTVFLPAVYHGRDEGRN